ncbi:MAG: type IV pilus twitching motility protein PilT [Bdellovibrionales bacterium]|nr:type IV pilus twitching motility protein PilT [Bdellovibrionales bacterium]
MAKLDELFNLMVKEGASDLHVSTGYSPYFRMNSHMLKLNLAPLTPEKALKYISETMSQSHFDRLKKDLELDWSYRLPGVGRFRANAFWQENGIGAVYRAIPDKIKSLKELGLPETLKELTEHPKGLVLVTGPTGSGKSTTLASLIHYINTTKKKHIITIEDPIEYLHKGINCLINQRELERHTRSFARALRAALREDPDIILVGELRDLETMTLAMMAAETGHLVFATLHTNSAAKSIHRIVSSFPSEQQNQTRTMLSESLVGVIAQTLLPTFHNDGMVPAIEYLIATSAIRNLIREDKVFQIPTVIQTSAKIGMISFKKSVQDLADNEIISPDVAETYLKEL